MHSKMRIAVTLNAKFFSRVSRSSTGIAGFREDRRGAVAVETAMVLVPFLALLLGAIQLFIVFETQQVLETAAETAGRVVLTGNAQTMTASTFQTAVCSAIPAFVKCGGIMVDMQAGSSFANGNVSKPVLTYDKNGNVTNPWVFQIGNPGDVVVLRVLYQAPIISIPGLKLGTQANGSRLLMATSVFKNEAYK